MSSPWLYRYGLQNLAQVLRLTGRPAPELFARALALSPDDQHLRWQAGIALAESGRMEEAAAALRPLAVSGTSPSAEIAEALLAALLTTGQDAEAISTYEGLAPAPQLTSGTAARLVGAYLRQVGLVPPEHTAPLLRAAFGWSAASEAARAREAELSSPGFWAGPFGEAIRAALMWRDHPPWRAHGALSWQGTTVDQAAAALGVSPADLSLGPELVANGGFEAQQALTGYPTGWQPALATAGTPWNLGAFVIEADAGHAAEGAAALRVDGLVVERRADREAAAAGLVSQPITLGVGQPYVLSLAYCTAGVAPEPSIFLANEAGVLLQEVGFPPTAGRWRRFVIVGWNRTDRDASVTPLLRLRSEGSVWFDSLSLRPLVLAQPLQARETTVVSDEALGLRGRCAEAPPGS